MIKDLWNSKIRVGIKQEERPGTQKQNIIHLCSLDTQDFCLDSGKLTMIVYLVQLNRYSLLKTGGPNWWELHGYLPSWEGALSKDIAKRKISTPKLSEESNHKTGVESTSKLPGKLKSLPVSQVMLLAKVFQRLASGSCDCHSERAAGTLYFISGDYVFGPLPDDLDCEDCCLDSW